MERFKAEQDAAIRAELQAQRDEWERDMQAIAAFERWYLDKLTLENDAENL